MKARIFVLFSALTLFACEDDEPGGTLDGAVPHDAGIDAQVDARPLDAQAEAGPLDAGAPVACENTSSCRQDELCAPTGYCMPRCDVNGVCVATISARPISTMTAVGASLYYIVASTTDALGNPRNDAELRRLSEAGEVTLRSALSGTSFRRLEHHGGYLYWSQWNPDTGIETIWRLTVEGSSAPESLYASARSSAVVLSAQHLALGQLDGIYFGSLDGVRPLEKKLEASACRTGEVDAGSPCTPLALTENVLLFRREMGGGAPSVASFDLTSGAVKSHGLALDSLVGATASHYYVARTIYSEGYVKRHELGNADAPEQFVHRLTRHDQSYVALQLKSGWLYAAVSASGAGAPASEYDFSVERASISNLGELQTLPRPSIPPGTSRFGISLLAVSDTHVFTVGLVSGPVQGKILGSVLYRMPLATAP